MRSHVFEDDIQNALGGKANVSHTHQASDIEGLQQAVNQAVQDYLSSNPVQTPWGSITGTLSNQVDLQSVLDQKVSRAQCALLNALLC